MGRERVSGTGRPAGAFPAIPTVRASNGLLAPAADSERFRGSCRAQDGRQNVRKRAGKGLGAGRTVLACLVAVCALAAAAGAQTPIAGRASVIDADTLEIAGQRIRLHGVDAPESAQTCERQGKPWRCGQAAALALADWLGAGPVSCLPVDRDRYGRTVARCSKAGQDVAGWLVTQGWAMDWPRYSGGAYAAAQDDAQQGERGIWGSVFLPPWEWRASRR